MTEALTAQLGATGAIRVMSRASVIHATGSGKTASEIGRTLGADAILHGTVERTSDRIRLSLRLTDVTTGRMLWSDDFERSRREVSEGDAAALEQLLPVVYRELRRIATRQLRRERVDHTLVPTALVHELYLRLVDQRRVTWENRAHFFGLAAHLMRRILVDHARAHHAAKRGDSAVRVSLDVAVQEAHNPAGPEDVLAVDIALERLAKLDPSRRASSSSVSSRG